MYCCKDCVCPLHGSRCLPAGFSSICVVQLVNASFNSSDADYWLAATRFVSCKVAQTRASASSDITLCRHDAQQVCWHPHLLQGAVLLPSACFAGYSSSKIERACPERKLFPANFRHHAQQVCPAGYGSSKARGLPGGMKVEDLHMAKVEPIPAVTDRNPDVECEFFHTRQVRNCLL